MSKLIKKAFALVVATVSLGLFADQWNDDAIKITDASVGDNWKQEVGKTIVAIPAAAVTNNAAEADWTKRPTWSDKATIAQIGSIDEPTNEFSITVYAPSGYKTAATLKKGVKGSAKVTINGEGTVVDQWEYSWTTNDLIYPSTKIPDDRFKKVLGIAIKPEWFNACVRTNSADYGLNKDFVDISFEFKWNSETVARTWNLRLYADGVILPTEGTKEIAGMTLKNVRGFPEEYAALFDTTSQMPVLKPWEGGSQKDPAPAWQPAVTNFTILETRDITLPSNVTDTANCKFTGWTVAPTAATPIDPANVIARAEYAKEICDAGKGLNNFTGVVFTASWTNFAWFVTTNAVVGTETNEVKIGFTDLTGALALVNSLTNYTEGVTLSLNDNFYAPYETAEAAGKYFYELDCDLQCNSVTNLTVDFNGGKVAGGVSSGEMTLTDSKALIKNGKFECNRDNISISAITTIRSDVHCTNLVVTATKEAKALSISSGPVTLDGDVEIYSAKQAGIIVTTGALLVVPEGAPNVYVTGAGNFGALLLYSNVTAILRSGYFKGASKLDGSYGWPFSKYDEGTYVTTNWVGALFETSTIKAWSACAKGMIPVDQDINGKTNAFHEAGDYRDGTIYRYGFMAVPENATSSIDGSDPVTGNPVYAYANTTITNKAQSVKSAYEFAVKVTAPTNDGFKATIQKSFNVGAEPGVKADIAGVACATLDQLELGGDITNLVEDGSFTWYVATSHDQLRAAAEAGTVVTNTIAINWDGQNGVTNLITVTIDPMTVVLWDETNQKIEWPRESEVTMCDEKGNAITVDNGYNWKTNGVNDLSWQGKAMTQDNLAYNELDAITNKIGAAGFFEVKNFADNDAKGLIFKGWKSDYLTTDGDKTVIKRDYIGEDVVLTSSWANAWWYVRDTNGAMRVMCETLSNAYETAKSGEAVVLNTGKAFGDVYTSKEAFEIAKDTTIDLNGGKFQNYSTDYLLKIVKDVCTISNGTYVTSPKSGKQNKAHTVDVGKKGSDDAATLILENVEVQNVIFCYNNATVSVVSNSNVTIAKKIGSTQSDDAIRIYGTNVVLNLADAKIRGEKNGPGVTFGWGDETVPAYAVLTTNSVAARFNTASSNIVAEAFAEKILPYDYADVVDYRYGLAEVGTDDAVTYYGTSLTNEEDDVYEVTVGEGATINYTTEDEKKAGLGKDEHQPGYFAEIAITAPAGIQNDFNAYVGKTTYEYGDKAGNIADIPGVENDGSYKAYVEVTPEQLREAAIGGTNVTAIITNFWWDVARMTVVNVSINPSNTVLIAEDGTKVWPRDFALTVTNMVVGTDGWTTNASNTKVDGSTTNILHYSELDAITNKTGIGSFRVWNLADRYGFDDGCGGTCNYKFTGWDVGEKVIVTDPETGYTYLPANLATNAEFGAVWTKAPWTRLDANGATNGIYTTLSSAYEAVASDNETLRLDTAVDQLTGWQNLSGGKYPVTIDLNGNTILAKSADYLKLPIYIDGSEAIEFRNGDIVNELPYDGSGHATRGVYVIDTAVTFRDVNLFADIGILAERSSVVATNVTLTVPAGIEAGSTMGASLKDCPQVAFMDVVIGENTSWSNSFGLAINGCGQVALDNTRVYGQDYASAVAINNSAVTVNGGEYQSYEAATFSAEGSSLTVTNGTVLTTFGVAASIGFAGADADDVLTIGQATIDSQGNAVSFKGGTLVTLPDSGLYARSMGDTLVIENTAVTIDPKNVCIWGGNFEVGDYFDIADGVETADRHLADFERSEVTDYRRALLSLASDPFEPAEKFLTIAPGCAPAQFSTIIANEYVADGYQNADNGEVYPDSWFFVDALDYTITYDPVDGVINEPTVSSYAITNSVVLPSDVTKKSYNFLGWTNEFGQVFAPGGIWNEGLDQHVNVKFYAQWGKEAYYLTVNNRSSGTPVAVKPVSTNIVMRDLEPVTLEKPVAKGYTFNYWVASSGKQYFAATNTVEGTLDPQYTINDFDWTTKRVWDSVSEQYVEKTVATITANWTGETIISVIANGKVVGEYADFKDAYAKALATPNSELVFTSGKTGAKFEIDETLLVTNDTITVDFNGCKIVASENFVGDALVVISNAPNAVVGGGTLFSNDDAITLIRTFNEDVAYKMLDSSYELTLVSSDADLQTILDNFVKDGYTINKCEIVPIVYTVTYNDIVADGSETNDVTAIVAAKGAVTTFTVESETFNLDVLFEKPDFTSDGWYNENGKVEKIEKGTIGNVVVYDVPVKAVSYTITFDTNGGDQETIAPITYTIDDQNAGVSLPQPTKIGSAFSGWFTNGVLFAAKGEKFQAAGFALGNLALKAGWDTETYKVTWNLDYDAEFKAEKDSRITNFIYATSIPLNDPKIKGFKLVDWTVTMNGETKNYEVGSVLEGAHTDVEITANLVARDYTVTYLDPLEVYATTGAYAITNDVLTLPTADAMVKAGYTFKGWVDVKGNPATEIAHASTGDKSFTAVWSVNEYTVTYLDKDGNDVTAEMYANGATTNFTVETPTFKLAVPYEREHYTFVAWSQAEVAQGTTQDITVTPSYAADEYVVSYVLNGGIQNAANTNRADGTYVYTFESDTLTLASPTHDGLGWSFTGWTLADGTEVQAIVKGETFGDKTLFANWSSYGIVTLTFDANGGETVGNVTYTEETRARAVIPTVNKAGSVFVGWADADGNIVYTAEQVEGGVIPTETTDTNYIAVWEKSLWSGNSVIEGNLSAGDPSFDGAAQITYTGYLLDKAGKLAGKVAVTAGKAASKKIAGETKKVASITMTVSATMGSAKSYTFKNATVVVDGSVLSTNLVSGSKATLMTAAITISNNGVEGAIASAETGYALDGYTIVASADRFATNVTKVPAAALAYLQGNWTVAFQSTNFCHGATTLKLTVAAKGKVTVTGNLGDGTSVSTTAQLIYGDGVCLCPVVINAYTGKVGGFAFNLWFGTKGTGDNLADEVEITDITDLIGADGSVLCPGDEAFAVAQRVADCKMIAQDYAFTIPLEAISNAVVEAGYEKSGTTYTYEPLTTQDVVTVAWNGTKHVVPTASSVKVTTVGGEPVVTWSKQSGNDLGLALTFTAKTGAATGSFKIYALQTATKGTKVTYSLKTFTFKVYGVMLAEGRVVEGAAVESTLGSYECHVAEPGAVQGE